jgi:hypothetical protein
LLNSELSAEPGQRQTAGQAELDTVGLASRPIHP